jgi:hypothetical protein
MTDCINDHTTGELNDKDVQNATGAIYRHMTECFEPILSCSAAALRLEAW